MRLSKHIVFKVLSYKLRQLVENVISYCREIKQNPTICQRTRTLTIKRTGTRIEMDIGRVEYTLFSEAIIVPRMFMQIHISMNVIKQTVPTRRFVSFAKFYIEYFTSNIRMYCMPLHIV